jgi:hypothetical protein
MNGKRTIVLSIAGALALAGLLMTTAGVWASADRQSSVPPVQADAVPSTISYQGRLLNTDGTPVDGVHMIAFRIYAQASGSTPLWSDSFPISVDGGLFHVTLDVDPVLFDGQALWLGVQVEGDAEEMMPRQPLLPAPYALHALSVPWAGLTGVPAGLDDGDDDTTYTAGTGLSLVGTQFRVNTSYRLPQGCGSDQIAKWNGSSWGCGDDDTGTDGWSLTGNSGTDPTTDFLGTADGVSLTLAVSRTSALRLEPNDTSPNLVGGNEKNSVAPGVAGAVIGGGGISLYPNRVTADFGTVGGGLNNIGGFFAAIGGGTDNTASGEAATVSGGAINTASGHYATLGGGTWNTAGGYVATVGGGYFNTASGNYATIGGGAYNSASYDYATVGGGADNFAIGGTTTVGGGGSNTASGNYATVGGGRDNTASGNYATVGEGRDNTASGDYSFAAGEQASASHDGSFVWASDTVASSWGPNTFTARAHGGVRFYSGSAPDTGVQLSSGGSSWGSISDRNAKENFADVDAGQVLETLAAMPIQTWNLKAQSPEMRHIGPVAQDFNGEFAYLFGEVESPTHVNNMDAIGVALVSVQGLYAQNQELTAENAALQAEVNDLEARVAALEAAVGAPLTSGQGLGGWLSLDRLGALLLGGLVAVVVVVRRLRSSGGGL